MPETDIKGSRKPQGRAQAARTPLDEAERHGQHVKFTASNGEIYQVDVVKMCQQNLNSGNRKAIIHKGGKWFFDGSSKGKDIRKTKTQWCAYPSKVQPILESAFRDSSTTGCVAKFAEEGNSCVQSPEVCQTLQCTQGHPLWISLHWNHTCDLCDTQGTRYQCSQGCDYDMCCHCFQDQLEKSRFCKTSVDSLIAITGQTPPSSLKSQDVRAACEAVFTAGVSISMALRTLHTLVCDHGLQFSADDARRVAFSSGSVEVLQLVLCTPPQVQLLGLEIFDRHYSGLDRSVLGFKSCIKILLARGARLGKFAPTSKLLRKFEADTKDAWAQRYLA